MAGPNETENLKELIEPIKPYIRGVNALIHDADEFDAGASYLLKINNELGAGNIIFGRYGRHDHSRNRILYETEMKEGDWYCQTDVLEHPKAQFFEYFTQYLVKDNSSIDGYYYYGKPFFVKFNESLHYQGNPHESLIGLSRVVELSIYHPDERAIRENMRPVKRANQPFHWVNHYARYLLLENSNQNLLGLEHHAQKYPFEKLEKIRKDLVQFLAKNIYPRTTAGLLESMIRVGPKGEMKEFINGHKILNDFYRFNVLKDQTVKDSHSQEAWDSMPQF
jgi:hypothetical protein